MNSREERTREHSRLRSARYRARKKSKMEELRREAEKLRNVVEYLRENALDHWQPILHRETTEQPTNDLVDTNNLLWDEDLFAGIMVNADCEESKFAGEIQIPAPFKRRTKTGPLSPPFNITVIKSTHSPL